MQIRFQREKNIRVTFWSCERVRKKAFKGWVETDKTESSIFVLISQSPWRYLLVCQTCRPSHLARLNLRKQQLTMTFVQVGICFFSVCIWARASACTSGYAHMTVSQCDELCQPVVFIWTESQQDSDPMGCSLHMCTYVCMHFCMYDCRHFWETDSHGPRECVPLGCMCGEMPCLCVDVDCMYYADLGEPCAINKTGLQCAHWRNNLSDTMEKEGEREGMEQTETSPEREERKTSEERMKKRNWRKRKEQG